MDQTTLLMLLLPILVIQLGLMVFTLIDLVKNPNPKGPKWLWGAIIVFINILGPILYLAIGRRNY
ncbi:PLD nuclease N-terminal domain-containing protein [Planococcus shenhongbingii]|uniref:PLD nuclease N-terminal domain-containing protein n=1 Tax=Planococcus shenhongbingii TaxID=3058398 RepID=A0ABT8NBF8_9BACL|nr:MULTISPECIES: PLD nuclease N-terminal domain-containing protein [unclassified Planococcus (in: firmicutes)]MDN7245029.1 PLD nuclease N-terminal domain-containing protein [Planococcus sp. N017]WKA58127.1 PLD nuclease N-terminal domain-containing protein [Planococcus sp. N016]